MYEIDRELDVPLYVQIRDNIVAAMSAGRLKPGDRLPSVCSLAKEIGVTQATIRRALQDLVDAGHTECHVGRGTFIRDASAGCEATACTYTGTLEEIDDESGRNSMRGDMREHAARRLRRSVSKALYDIMPLAHKPGIIAMTKGTPDEKMIPEGFLEELCQLTLERGAARYVQATDPIGLADLREEIARRASRDGSKVTPDMVMITNGVMQAITLVAQHYMESRPEVICETPCFQGVSNSFAAMGHWVETVRRDDNGPMVDQLERFSTQANRLLYLCPYAHNPMGTNLSPDRSAYLVEWARKTGSVLIVDEIFRELQFSGEGHPSLIRQLGGEQTIVVNSLSKSIMSGLRIGWIITSPRRIQELAQLKKLMDHSAPTFMQGMAFSLLRSGKFETHTQQMVECYKRRMNTMLKSLQKMMPAGVRWSQPDGGFSILLELPTGYSSVALLFSAIDMGVSFLPGPLFDID
ncbi:aminotransferase-like domain-containing protein [Desulfopila aestuarii]|nr:PLP-dependent aminotransferase family protein [Desulfopila aestuarii]